MNLKILAITLLTTIGVTSNNSQAQSIDKIKLDQYFRSLQENNKFMGSVAVAQNGNIIYTHSIGFADVESKKVSNEKTKYRIGSISKTFTAALVLKASEEKKLALNQTLDKFYPAIKSSEKITIEHLLRHRSGIHNITNDSSYLQYYTQPISENDLVDIIVRAGTDFDPGTKSEYSNSNYVILSFILQKVYKKSYATILQEKIIKSIGLESTYFGSDVDLSKNESNSYQYFANWVKQPFTHPSIPMGAGSIVSTPSDLTKFADALFNGKIVSQESLAFMMELKDNFGLGIFKIPFYDKVGYGHTGGIDGFSSVFAYFPVEKIAYAMISNGSNYDNNNVSIAVLSSVYNKPFEIPSFSNTTYAVTTEELDQYLGIYASQQIALKITITKSDTILMAQATNQAAFPLDATAKHVFRFDRAGVVLEFEPTLKQLTLKQNGATFLFRRE